jgi:HAD superfamily hydrolase (TIGR01509 family)
MKYFSNLILCGIVLSQVLLTAFAFSNAVNTRLGLLNQNYDLILWYFASIFAMILCISFNYIILRDCDGKYRCSVLLSVYSYTVCMLKHCFIIGVLVDSEALLKQGEVEALASHGITVTEMDCIRMFSGYSPDAAAVNFLREMKRPLPDNFIRDQIAGSMDLFRKRLIPLMTGTIETLYKNKVPMCVASGSPRDRVLLSLDVGGMKDYFLPEHVFTRELVARGKPAPDLFLFAAEKMGVRPERCIVVEDSAAGIDAAKAANMACIAYLGGTFVNYCL